MLECNISDGECKDISQKKTQKKEERRMLCGVSEV